MAKEVDFEFQKWVEENNLTEDDLRYIQRTARNRAILYLFIGAYFTLPLHLIAWTQYKVIKQRTFKPRVGILFSLESVAMYITFIMIIPAIIWAVANNKGFGSGIRGLWKKGLIGEGEISADRREKFKKIKRSSRAVRILISILIVAGLFAAAVFIDYNGDFGRFVAEEFASQTELIEMLIGFFLIIDIYIGMPISAIINNVRYKRYL